MQALLRDFALEQGELHIARNEKHRAGIVDVGDATHHEPRPLGGCIVEHRRDQEIDQRQAFGLQLVQVAGRHQHGADAGLRVRIYHQHVFAVEGRHRLRDRKHDRGFPDAALRIHDGDRVAHLSSQPRHYGPSHNVIRAYVARDCGTVVCATMPVPARAFDRIQVMHERPRKEKGHT